MCSNKDIQELLPAYLEQALLPVDQSLVEQHLATCGECSAELALLRALADDPVPDPGDAFWASFPDRVRREALGQQDAARTGASSGGLRIWFGFPRLAWALSLLLAVGVAAGLFLHPATPPRLAAVRPADDVPAYDDSLVPEPSPITELSSSELDSIDSWANNELAPLREEVGNLFLNGPDGTIESSLDDMNKQQLQQLSKMLDSEREEISI